MHQRIADAADVVGLYARTAFRTGGLGRMGPRALGVMLHHRLAGATGPSTMYRVNAAAEPDKVAIVWGDTRITFGELDRRIDGLAGGLQRQHGIRRADAGVIIMRNRPEVLEAQAAMSRLGGGAVSISWRSTPAELDYLINHSGARAVFVEAEIADNLLATRRTLTRIPEGNLIGVGGVRDGLTPYEDVLGAPGKPQLDLGEPGAVVIYTSGTTGKPKGAVRRFPKTTQEAVLRFIVETPIHNEDRHLAICPMYHSTAFGFIGFTFVVGGTVVIADRFEPEEFLALVERERITTTAMVPTMLHRVLSLPEATISRYDTRSLRAVFSGGAPLSGPLARRFMDRFGHVLYNFYGATETGINTLATPHELLTSPGTIGHVVGGNEIRLLDDRGEQAGVGETGELWVRNDMLVAGYHQDDQATQQSMLEGFFSVGDLAHQDEHGLLHIDGRKRDMIISGGVNIYPAEVEEVLARHPAIAEAAVVGIADEEWGERVRAFVSLHAGADATVEEIIAYARSELAGTKVPREVIILPDLPRNPTGKVLKTELRAWSP